MAKAPFELRSALRGPRFFGAVGYVSPRERDLTPQEQHVRETAIGLKTAEPAAVKEAARAMAFHVPQGSILAPVPSSKKGPADHATTALTKAVAALVPGASVNATLASRKYTVPSSRVRRQSGLSGLSTVAHAISMQTTKPGREQLVILIDNVLTSGATMRGVWASMGRPTNVFGLAYAATLYTTEARA